MKYRTKLFLAVIGTAVVSSLCGYGVLFIEFKHHVLQDEEVKTITVSATTASLIDPELFKNLNTRADEATLAYTQAKQILAKVRNANRRNNIYIESLYTIKPNPNQPGEMIFVVDAEEDPHKARYVGEMDKNSLTNGIIHHLGDYYSPGKFFTDPSGKFLTGFAPLFDKNGNYVATIAADISIQHYLDDIFSMVKTVSIAFAVALIFAIAIGYWMAHQVTLSLNSLLSCVKEISQGNFSSSVGLETGDEFEELGNAINSMTKGLRERERLKLNFARYVSQHVMDTILKSEHVAKLEGERRKITVLFSDIRQFTQLSERLRPEDVVSLLNEYFEVMLDVIFRHQGTLDKFLGDGIMVEFGAPLDDEKQELHAVQTAIGMQRELKKLVMKWEKEGRPKIEIGIGVHTGLAVVGNIGSEKRIEYTAIGDTVNVASRLEQATKLLKKPILISETTYEGIKDTFKALSLGPMILPGRSEAITIYVIDEEA